MSRPKRQRVAKIPRQQSNLTFIKSEVPVPESAAAVPEDIFAGQYYDGSGGTGDILAPPYDFGLLEQLVERNSTLGPCIAAYTVNIDGTGYTIAHNGEEVNPLNPVVGSEQFFDLFGEVSPGKTLLTLRQETRATLETTGNAFIEVVRNIDNEITFINLLPTSSMRLVRLGEPHTVVRDFRRSGKVVPLTFSARERAFAQVINTQTIYFREFGTYQDIHKSGGEWTTDKLSLTERGNEIIHLTVNKAANSSYGVPRWINQIPSVMGSREAEEANLQSVATGGLHAAWVFLTGGCLEPAVRKQFENLNAADAKSKLGVAIVEVMSAGGGSIDTVGHNPGVTVHKFGSESSKDAMYEKYDDKTHRKILSAFRLHGLFIGEADSINRATAEVIYALTEAQAFKPERDEYDEKWNMTIMAALDPTGAFKFHSNPIVLKFVLEQLKASDLVKGVDGVEVAAWISNINKIAGTSFVYEEPVEVETPDGSEESPEDLAKSFWTKGVKSFNMSQLEELTSSEQTRFYKHAALLTLPGAHHDLKGAVELIKCECGETH
jgi:PBSX family phage portal protein